MIKSLKILIIPLTFLVFPFLTQAACNVNTKIDFIARDPDNSFIPSVKVEVYRQEMDANGHPKPANRLASGTTDKNLGIAHLSFRNSLESDTYALKVQAISKDAASYWYYDNILACGESATIEKTLSGIIFTLRDADGNLLPDTKFNVYSQVYDSNGNPLKERRELLATLNTAYSGRVKAYLPQGSVRSINNAISDHYALELVRSKVKFYFYNISVLDSKLTTLDYYLSALRIRLQDVKGSSFPSGTQVEVYTQEIDADNQPSKGEKIGTFKLADDGFGNFEVSAGVYALAVKGKNGQYQNFWNIEAEDGRITEHILTTDQSWIPLNGVCETASNLNIILRSYGANNFTGLKFELYEQNTDTNGIPVSGLKVGGGTFNSSGRYTFNFKPDPRKTYALKIWDKNANLGEFWFFDAARFVCGYDRTVTKKLNALNIILRDTQSVLKKNYSFSLYMQEYDADGNPVINKDNLIANLKTDNTGKYSVYLAPYNTYLPNQTGFYALSMKGSQGQIENFYNIIMPTDKDYNFESSMSGLNGRLIDMNNDPMANKNLSLYEQKINNNSLSLGQKLLSFKTNQEGSFQLEYTSGTYALVSPDYFNRQNIFWNIKIDKTNEEQTLKTSLINFNLNNSEDKKISDNPSLQLYLLTGNGGTYYRGEKIGTIKLKNNKASLSLAAGKYLVFYEGAENQSFGKAFYAKNGLFYNVDISLNDKYLINDKQSFWLPGAEDNPVISSPDSSNSSGLALRLKGRILLQVQDKGQAWYVNPLNAKRYSLGRPEEAYKIMRELALGISNQDFSSLENNSAAWRRLAGRILLKTQDSGRAYYFDPTNLELYYLGRPQDAFNVMRSRGLGITNNDLGKVLIAN